ncbi:MAG: ATP-binding cassette domain-containing protein [Asgard group archaeon]|nr:ATP-binding cassette domain-containing protein [Asgard group archaeon]
MSVTEEDCSSIKPEITIWSIYYFNPITTRDNDQLRRKVTKILKSLGAISYNFEELTAFMVVRSHFCLDKEESIDKNEVLISKAEEILISIETQIKTVYQDYLENIISKFIIDIKKNKELKEAANILIKNLILNDDKKEQFLTNVYQSIESKSLFYSDVIKKSLFFISNVPSLGLNQIDLEDKTIKATSEKSLTSVLDELILFNFAFAYGSKTKIVLKQFIDSFKAVNKYLKKMKDKNPMLEDLLEVLKGKSFEVMDNIYEIRRQIARQNRAEREIKAELQDINNIDLNNYVEKNSPTKLIQQIVKQTDSALKEFEKWFDYLRKFELIEYYSQEVNITVDFTEKVCDLFIYMELLRIWSEFFYDISYFTVKKGRILEATDIEVKDTIETDAVLVADDVYKTYKLPKSRVYALRGVSLEIKQGEFLAIMGPSGAGKTTLVNILTGLDSPDKGVVYLNGQNIALMDDTELTIFRRDQIGLIFQFYQLFGELTALENVSMPAEMAGIPVSEAREKAQQILEVVDLGAFANQYPDKLSGGQQQRVAIARALVNSPSLVVADQLTGDLDSVTGMQIIGYLRKINNESGATILLVTHNKAVATQADRILTIDDGEIIEEIDMVKIRQASE